MSLELIRSLQKEVSKLYHKLPPKTEDEKRGNLTYLNGKRAVLKEILLLLLYKERTLDEEKAQKISKMSLEELAIKAFEKQQNKLYQEKAKKLLGED